MQLRRLLALSLAAGLLLLSGCSGNDGKAFDKVDYNKDGKVIFEELIIAFPDLTVDEFLAADANHDGALEEKEYKRFREARQTGKKLAAPSAPQSSAPQSAAPAAAPSMPTAPSASAAPIPAASPATPAQADQTAPAAPAASTPAVTPPAAPETPAPAPAEAASAKPAGITYTVQSGDSLSRIARKFGIGVQEIMDANGMHDADRLDAGATLTIPGAAGAVRLAPPAVTAFVANVFARSATGDVNALLDLYDEKVDYDAKGRVGRDVVRQDKVRLFSRWPKRTYKPGAATVSEPSEAGELRVTVPVAFTLDNGGKTVSGTAVYTFGLRPEGDGYRIVGESSVVPKRQ